MAAKDASSGATFRFRACIGTMNRWRSPSPGLPTPSPTRGERDGVRGWLGSWRGTGFRPSRSRNGERRGLRPTLTAPVASRRREAGALPEQRPCRRSAFPRRRVGVAVRQNRADAFRFLPCRAALCRDFIEVARATRQPTFSPDGAVDRFHRYEQPLKRAANPLPRRTDRKLAEATLVNLIANLTRAAGSHE